MKLFNIITENDGLVLLNPYYILYCNTDPTTRLTEIVMTNGRTFTTKESISKISESADKGFSAKVPD